MTVSKAQIMAQMRYNAKTYEQVNIQVKKGTKDRWKQAAIERNLGLMALVRDSVEEFIQNHPIDEKGGD